MDRFLLQAKHNQTFHDCIAHQFQDKFFDRKVTSLFYVAIHSLKGLAALKKIAIGVTHYDIERSVNPDSHAAKMQIKRGAWIDYKTLFNYSCWARYDGFTDEETFELLKRHDHQQCVKHLQNFKKYLSSQGLTV